MWPFLSNKKPKEVRYIVFNEGEKLEFPLNVRVPSVGETIWMDVHHQGEIVSITNVIEFGFFVTTIHVKSFYE